MHFTKETIDNIPCKVPKIYCDLIDHIMSNDSELSTPLLANNEDAQENALTLHDHSAVDSNHSNSLSQFNSSNGMKSDDNFNQEHEEMAREKETFMTKELNSNQDRGDTEEERAPRSLSMEDRTEVKVASKSVLMQAVNLLGRKGCKLYHGMKVKGRFGKRNDNGRADNAVVGQNEVRSIFSGKKHTATTKNKSSTVNMISPRSSKNPFNPPP